MNAAKKQTALDCIQQALANCNKPVVFSSFGKDSLATMALLDEVGADVETAYFELGVEPARHAFARKSLAESAASAHILRAARTVLVRNSGRGDLGYEILLTSGDRVVIVGATMRETGADNLHCAIQAGLHHSPISAQPYDWDMVFCGRKDLDLDVTVGSLRWGSAVHVLAHGARVAMPLLSWSEKDVCEYLDERHISVDAVRYARTPSGYAEHADKKLSPDHLNCCTRCLLAPRGGSVHCPVSDAAVTAFAGVEEAQHRIDGAVSPAFMF